MPSASPARANLLRAVVLSLIASACAVASAHAADLAHPSLPGRLSDERAITRWATALTSSPIRRAPDAHARATARLRYYTEDRLPEIYVGLEQKAGADGNTWVRIRIPRRPNGTTGCVRRAALNDWHVSTTFLAVDRRARTATLYRGARAIWRSRVGVGKPATPTPTGRFYVRERIRNLAGNPSYGPIAFGTSAYSRLSDWPGGGVIGIHGTDEPELLPGRVSHGCVRVPNPAIRRRARLLTVGTPVRISDGPGR